MNLIKVLNKLVFFRSQNSLIAETEYISTVQLEDGSKLEGFGEINTLNKFQSDWLLSQKIADLGFTDEETFGDIVTGLFDKIDNGEILLPEQTVDDYE